MSPEPGSGSDREPWPAAGRWEVDASSTVGFVARQFLVHRVRGRFDRFRATLDVGEDRQPTVSGEVQASSVETGDPARDDHLRSPDFFDVERWPTMALTGRVTGPGPEPDTLLVDAELTIRGITRAVPFTVRQLRVSQEGGGSPVLSATALATVNRKDFGLQWTPTLETGGVVVADRVELVLDLRARRLDDR